MARKKLEIVESVESMTARENELKNVSLTVKSLKFPQIDKNGLVTAKLTTIQPCGKGQPVTNAITGEVKTNYKTGEIETYISDQFEFYFETPVEDSNETMHLRMWTNTGVDSIKDKEGRYSRLTTFLIAIDVLDSKKLHPKYKADAASMQEVIVGCIGESFTFEVELNGRMSNPVIDTIRFLEIEETEQPEDTNAA